MKTRDWNKKVYIWRYSTKCTVKVIFYLKILIWSPNHFLKEELANSMLKRRVRGPNPSTYRHTTYKSDQTPHNDLWATANLLTLTVLNSPSRSWHAETVLGVGGRELRGVERWKHRGEWDGNLGSPSESDTEIGTNTMSISVSVTSVNVNTGDWTRGSLYSRVSVERRRNVEYHFQL